MDMANGNAEQVVVAQGIPMDLSAVGFHALRAVVRTLRKQRKLAPEITPAKIQTMKWPEFADAVNGAVSSGKLSQADVWGLIEWAMKRVGQDAANEAAVEVEKPVAAEPAMASAIDMDAIRKMIAEEVAKAKAVPGRIEVKVGEVVRVVEGRQHARFPTLVKMLGAKVSPMLVGPAGSGKTHACEQAAEALGLPFYMQSVCGQTTASALLGYQDASAAATSVAVPRGVRKGRPLPAGRDRQRQSERAGGAERRAVQRAVCAFPDGMIAKHADFRLVAAANTWGQRPHGGVRRPQPDRRRDAGPFRTGAVDVRRGAGAGRRRQRTWARYVQAWRKQITAIAASSTLSRRARRSTAPSCWRPAWVRTRWSRWCWRAGWTPRPSTGSSQRWAAIPRSGPARAASGTQSRGRRKALDTAPRCTYTVGQHGGAHGQQAVYRQNTIDAIRESGKINFRHGGLRYNGRDQFDAKWDSVTDLCGYVRKALSVGGRPAHPPSFDATGDWTWNYNTAEALALVDRGWPEAVAAIPPTEQIASKMLQELPEVTTEWDVTGANVDVGSYLSGVPECMLTFAEQKRETRAVRIVVNGFLSAGVEAEELFARGVAIMSVVLALQASGVAVSLELTIRARSTKHSKIGTYTVMLYQPGQAFDVSRLIVQLAHVAFYRRILGVAADLHSDYGYGASCDAGLPERPGTVNIAGMMLDEHPWTSEAANLLLLRQCLEAAQ
jgi:hypothetical protein